MKKVLIVALLILLCACTQNEMPIIETDTTPPETTIEPIQIIEEEIITTITNIDDWDLLGLNYTKDSEPYISLRAFLEKNTEIFEVSFGTTGLGLHLEYFNTVVSGMYDDFKTVEFGDYSITTEGTDYEIVFLNVEVLSSDMDTFPAGDYTFALYEAIWEYELRNINAKRNNSWPPSDLLTPAQKVISTWLGRGFPEINDYSKLEGREILTYNISITAFLHYIGADMTVETFSETVSKYFDIEDFEITDEDRYIKIEDGKYYPLAGAAGNMYYDFISESTENGITTVTVQFYADAMYLAKSHLIEYRLEDIGNGEYKIYCTNTLIKSKYPHLQWGV